MTTALLILANIVLIFIWITLRSINMNQVIANRNDNDRAQAILNAIAKTKASS